MAVHEGKVALITGGAGAIGGATARRFLDEGASVVLADRDEEALEATVAALAVDGSRVVARAVDVTDAEAIGSLVEAVVARFGRIDILFCCAGMLRTGSVTETSIEDWDRTLAVNLTAPFLVSRHVVPVMLRNGSGSIIHMSSTAGIVAEPGIAAYCASKGGVVMLARQMAVDYARGGIRVNVVCPGWIDTPFNDPAIAQAGGAEALAPFIDAMVPLGRQGRPEEVADTVSFLASDAARYMTGSVVLVDGGLTAQ